MCLQQVWSLGPTVMPCLVQWCGSCPSLLGSRLSSKVSTLPGQEGLSTGPRFHIKDLRLGVQCASGLGLEEALAQPELTQRNGKCSQWCRPTHQPCGPWPGPAPSHQASPRASPGPSETQLRSDIKVAARLLPTVFDADHSHFQTPAVPGPVATRVALPRLRPPAPSTCPCSG